MEPTDADRIKEEEGFRPFARNYGAVSDSEGWDQGCLEANWPAGFTVQSNKPLCQRPTRMGDGTVGN
jgi:hypothetical protein